MPTPEQLLTHPALQPFWLMLLVILVERVWAWPDKYHPLSAMRLLANNMARKVHPSTTRSISQQKISGSLAILVLLLPLLVILALLVNLAEYPVFFDCLLLLVALHFQPVVRNYQKIAWALKSEKKALARSLLNPMVLRETHNLSSMGIAKAAIESLLLRFNYQYCAVLFWFLLLGGVGAIGYRLILEFSQSWNSKLSRFKHFGRPAAWLCGVLNWIPARLVALSFALAENISGAWRAYQRIQKGCHSHSTLLALKGGALAIQLGGPAYYEGHKVRFAKVGGDREIRFADMQRTLSGVRKTQAILLVMVLLVCTLIYAATMDGRI